MLYLLFNIIVIVQTKIGKEYTTWRKKLESIQKDQNCFENKFKEETNTETELIHTNGNQVGGLEIGTNNKVKH